MSHEVILNTIAATRTRSGLNVHAELDTALYATGVKIPDQQMKALEDSGPSRAGMPKLVTTWIIRCSPLHRRRTDHVRP